MTILSKRAHKRQTWYLIFHYFPQSHDNLAHKTFLKCTTMLSMLLSLTDYLLSNRECYNSLLPSLNRFILAASSFYLALKFYPSVWSLQLLPWFSSEDNSFIQGCGVSNFFLSLVVTTIITPDQIQSNKQSSCQYYQIFIHWPIIHYGTLGLFENQFISTRSHHRRSCTWTLIWQRVIWMYFLLRVFRYSFSYLWYHDWVCP